MITEAALITVSCVLFTQMGLADALQGIAHIRFRIVSCPKCTTFWICLAWTVLHDYGIIESVAASFIASYCALWLSLLYDSLARLYNLLYEQVTKTDGASEDAEKAGFTYGPEAGDDEVPKMQ